jgi:hypothetical protein
VFPDELNLSQAEQPMTGIALLHFVEGEETATNKTIQGRTQKWFAG